MSGKIPTGTTLELGSKLRALSRRSVLRGLATAATASGAALSAAVERAYGKPPEGKVIVHTDDIHGQPDTVRVIPKERYRRLKLYERLPIQKFTDREGVQALTITQQSDDPTDLALKFLVENNNRATRKRVPNNYNRVPTVVEEKPFETREELDFEGGSVIANPNTSKDTDGTVCLVGYDADGSGELVLTADHVMNGSAEMHDVNGKIGELHDRDQSLDVTSYKITSNIKTHPTGTFEDIPNITGAWRFAGLADKVGQTDDGDSVADGDTVPVELFGRSSSYVSDKCNNTKRSDQVEYQADMANHHTDQGDSGAPWVDRDGKLLGVHHGADEAFWGDKEWSTATVARPALNAVGVDLSKYV